MTSLAAPASTCKYMKGIEADGITELLALSVRLDRAGALSKAQPFLGTSRQIDR